MVSGGGCVTPGSYARPLLCSVSPEVDCILRSPRHKPLRLVVHSIRVSP